MASLTPTPQAVPTGLAALVAPQSQSPEIVSLVLVTQPPVLPCASWFTLVLNASHIFLARANRFCPTHIADLEQVKYVSMFQVFALAPLHVAV